MHRSYFTRKLIEGCFDELAQAHNLSANCIFSVMFALCSSLFGRSDDYLNNSFFSYPVDDGWMNERFYLH